VNGRYAAVCSATVLGVIAFQGSSSNALSMRECSAKYQAAKTGGTLNGMKWNEFRKTECGADATAARIIEMAQRGQTNPQRLSEDALQFLAMNYRD